MTTRTVAADQMRETAIVIGGNRSVTPARPHIIGAARHAAAEIDGVVETRREWARTRSRIGGWMRYGPTAWM